MKKLMVCWVLLAMASTAGLTQPRLGLGLGMGQGTDGQWLVGNAELFAELNGEAWLCSRFSVFYWPPLLPAETSAVVYSWGLRLAWGETFRPYMAAHVGAYVTSSALRGFVSALAFGGTAGVEWWISPGLGLYISAGAFWAQKTESPNSGFYPYFPWSIGILVSPPRPNRVLPRGIE